MKTLTPYAAVHEARHTHPFARTNAGLRSTLPQAPLLFAAAVLSLGALLNISTPARATTVLHNFTGGSADGTDPYGSLTLSGSKLYGMTNRGGSSTLGTIFSMNTDGTGFSLLHNFAAGASDGNQPYGSLTLSGSTLFGMTFRAGSNDAGTIFRMNTDGTGFSLIHSFTGGAVDGSSPFGSLAVSGSKLYGMTNAGGSSSSNAGTIFSINTDGSGFSQIHTFTGLATDGDSPEGNSLTVSGSKLYGMTPFGGSSTSGTIFSMNTDGTGFSLLHSFAGGTGDGDYPSGSLTLSGSKLYGLTREGGSSNRGTLFSINTDGTGFELLHSFAGGASDGRDPRASLTLSGSKLYGMTYSGGSSDFGTIFSINTDGTGYGLLESFSGSPADGAHPAYSDLTLSGDGSTLYGMTLDGGTADNGVIFSETVPEPASAALLLGGLALLGFHRPGTRARCG